METKIAETAAQILINTGYAVRTFTRSGRLDFEYQWVETKDRHDGRHELPVIPFEDKLVGIQQAHVIENYLEMFESQLWEKSKIIRIPITNNMLNFHQWRLNRIDACLSVLHKRIVKE